MKTSPALIRDLINLSSSFLSFFYVVHKDELLHASRWLLLCCNSRCWLTLGGDGHSCKSRVWTLCNYVLYFVRWGRASGKNHSGSTAAGVLFRDVPLEEELSEPRPRGSEDSSDGGSLGKQVGGRVSVGVFVSGWREFRNSAPRSVLTSQLPAQRQPASKAGREAFLQHTFQLRSDCKANMASLRRSLGKHSLKQGAIERRGKSNELIMMV